MYNALSRLHIWECTLLAARWYSHPSLNSDFFETRLCCNWQFKGHLQSIRHLSENSRPLIWILLKVNRINTSPSNPFQRQCIFARILPLLLEHPRQSKLSIWNERCSNLNHHWYADTAVPCKKMTFLKLVYLVTGNVKVIRNQLGIYQKIKGL